MSGYNLDMQVFTSIGACMQEVGCMSVAADSAAGTFASKTIAVPTRLSRVTGGLAISDTTYSYTGKPVSVCTGGWLDFTFADATMGRFDYIVWGY